MLHPDRTVCWLSLFCLWAVHLALAEGPVAVPASTDPVPLAVSTHGVWRLVESPNFRCWSQLPEADARRLAESCEALRTQLRTQWITNVEQSTWTPKCDVCVHPSRTAYNSLLNRPGDLSVGSTSMRFEQGRTVVRRIDLRADASDWSNAALPHELSHVVLGERFSGHALPRWADEGIAMLSESTEKHRERLENLQDIVAARSTLAVSDLVALNRMPAAHQRDAFYGQSLGLASMFLRKGTPAKFADFIEASIDVGIDRALQQHYAISGVAALQKEWNDWTRRPESMTFVCLAKPAKSGVRTAMSE